MGGGWKFCGEVASVLLSYGFSLLSFLPPISPFPLRAPNRRCRYVQFLKSGKVVIVLAGRYAGKKAVVVKTFDDGNDSRKFSHAISEW